MENEAQNKKRHHWELIPFLLAMLLSFFCVFTATAMAMMSQPDKLTDASMLPVGTANYGQLDNEKEQFDQLDDAIISDAAQDSAGLQLTPGSSGEASGSRKTPIYIAFVTPNPSDTPVPSPVVVTMNAPGTAVPSLAVSPVATSTPFATVTPSFTKTPIATATSTRFMTATTTPTLWPSPTNTVTPWPTYTPTNVPATSSPPTATSKPSKPSTSTPRPTATNEPVPTATNTLAPTSTATAISTATATNTPAATATNTATSTATATNTPTATATEVSAKVLNVALVNADTESVISGYETMPDGITLDLSSLPTENLNIWASLDPQQVHQVDISLTGTATRDHTERHYPYTFPGNTFDDGHPLHPYNDFWGYNFIPGAYTLTFQPYIDATTAGLPFIFNFNVIDSSIASVVPLVCIKDNGGGWYSALFNYRNDHAVPVTIPFGSDNTFSPDPAHRGQPTDFAPGLDPNYITTNFQSAESVSWILDGNTATADITSSICP